MSPRALALLVAAAALAGCGSVARVELSPASLRFAARGHSARVHAAPFAKNGKSAPDQICRWSTSDAKVATVGGAANDVVVTAAGPGTARVSCEVGGVRADVDVVVRVVAKVVAAPERVELRMLDEPAPVQLQVTAVDDAGAPVLGRSTFSRCAREEICRGDGRGQLWAAGPGDTTAVVEVEGTRSNEIAVHVVDARSADAKPKAVKGNPMEEIERKYQRKVAEEKKAAERAKAGR